MAEYIVMPKLGFDMREGVLNNWLKKVGESINKGEVVAEIESDKATLELEAQVAGTLLHLLHGPGDVVPIGANLAIVGQPGEDVSALTGGNGAADSYPPVSYTHLDVYKRQRHHRLPRPRSRPPRRLGAAGADGRTAGQGHRRQ